jgi:type II secretory pathway pseudopilin PulG
MSGFRAQRARGYTVVELMMATALFTVGVTGVIALQKVTVTANEHSKNLAVATRIAQSWQEMLAVDAIRWNTPSASSNASDLADTSWLVELENDREDEWFQPDWDAGLQFGAAFDALGNPVAPADAGRTRFCVHIRLASLFPADIPVAGNGMVRTEVRVFWRRPGVDNTEAFCSNLVLADSIGQNVQAYHFVYKAAAVRQNAI